MKIYLVLAMLTFTAMHSQKITNTPGMKDPSRDEIIYGNKDPFEQVDQFPEFKGNIYTFRESLIKNIDVKKFNKGKKIYETDLNFIIEKGGTVSSIEAKGDDKNFNLDVENAFKKMKTEWKSAKNSHWQVRYHVSVPIMYSQTDYVTNGSYENFFGTKKISTLEVFQEVEQPATYSNNTQNFKTIIQNKVKEIPDVYPFTMSFVIERDGTCTDLKITGKEDAKKNEVIKRSILPIKELWNPAKISGQTVRCKYVINFP